MNLGGVPFRRVSTKKHEVRVNCPFCGDGKFHAYINRQKKVFFCFRCGEKGPAARLLERLGVDRGTAVLAFGEIDSSIVSGIEEVSDPKLPNDFRRLPGNTVLAEKMVRYLTRRLGDKTGFVIGKYCLGFSGEERYAGRILAPVFDSGKREKKLLYVVGRSVFPGIRPKYLNSSSEKPLFGARQSVAEPLILVEGVFDAFVTRGVALLGTHLSSFQEVQLKLYLSLSETKTLVLAFDGDDAGRRAVPNVASRLRELFPTKTIVFWKAPSAQDPASLGTTARRQILADVCRFDRLDFELFKIG